MMMDAEMYGMMPSAKIPKRDSAPPENRLNMRKHVASLLLEETSERSRINAGHRNKRTSAKYDQCSQQEHDS